MQLMHATEPILSVVCNEPEGSITRSVYPMPFTPENIKEFYERTKEFRTLFTDDVNGDFKKFAEVFISQQGEQIYANGLCWVIDDFVGVFYLTHIGLSDAMVHYTFLDRRHHGREALTREMIRYVFRHFGFQRLSTEIPVYVSSPVFNFVIRLGFKKEGRKRKSKLYKGQWFDSVLLGVLREEADSWDSTQRSRKSVEAQL